MIKRVLFSEPWSQRALVISCICFMVTLVALITSIVNLQVELTLIILPIILLLTGLLATQFNLRSSITTPNRGDYELLNKLQSASLSVLNKETRKFEFDGQHDSKFSSIIDFINTINQRQLTCESQVQELAVQIQEKTDQLEAQKKMDHDRNQNLHKMFAGASHDLRQPLQAMVIFISAIQDLASEKQLPLLQKLEQVVENLNHMFTDLLDISKLESRMKRIPKKNVSIKPLLEKIYDEFEALAHDKGIEFRLYNRELTVYSNPNMLERIIRNMISNAIRYTRTGGVLIGCREREDEVWIEVWDTGKGIPPDKMNVIFDEFVQIHEKTNNSNKGVGLGLFIVKRLAQLLDHSIIARSTLHRGTMFRIIVPAQPMYPHSEFPKKANLLPMVKLDSPSLNIALIDDDHVIRMYLSELLRVWGMQVQTFDCIESLTNLAPPETTHLDLIISDFQLGVRDTGLQVIEYIRNQQKTKTPAIVITGTTDATLLKTIEGRSIPHLVKPVKPAKLRALINMLCKP